MVEPAVCVILVCPSSQSYWLHSGQKSCLTVSQLLLCYWFLFDMRATWVTLQRGWFLFCGVLSKPLLCFFKCALPFSTLIRFEFLLRIGKPPFQPSPLRDFPSMHRSHRPLSVPVLLGRKLRFHENFTLLYYNAVPYNWGCRWNKGEKRKNQRCSPSNSSSDMGSLDGSSLGACIAATGIHHWKAQPLSGRPRRAGIERVGGECQWGVSIWQWMSHSSSWTAFPRGSR